MTALRLQLSEARQEHTFALDACRREYTRRVQAEASLETAIQALQNTKQVLADAAAFKAGAIATIELLSARIQQLQENAKPS